MDLILRKGASGIYYTQDFSCDDDIDDKEVLFTSECIDLLGWWADLLIEQPAIERFSLKVDVMTLTLMDEEKLSELSESELDVLRRWYRFERPNIGKNDELVQMRFIGFYKRDFIKAIPVEAVRALLPYMRALRDY
jgi:hypothetical protein